MLSYHYAIASRERGREMTEERGGERRRRRINFFINVFLPPGHLVGHRGS